MSVPSNELVASTTASHLGGKVSNIERQLRWRPTWFLDVEIDGETRPFVVRGDRVDSAAIPLSHEYLFHSMMEKNGLKVPALHGYIKDLDGLDIMFMDRVPGVPHFDNTSDADRDVVVDEYLQQLAILHQLDPQPFIDAGVQHPEEGVDAGMVGHGNMIELYRENKVHPDPFMEFCVGWLERHRPQASGRLAPVVWDSGQFHHENGHLVALLDLEAGHIGDPLADITIWRMRDTLIPFGNMNELYARYETLTGKPVDVETIKRHHFAACLSNQLVFGAAVENPLPDTDLMTYKQWNSDTNLMATEFLGEYLEMDLPTIELPDAEPSRDDAALMQLVRSLGSVRSEDSELGHELRLAFRKARHLQRRNEIGHILDEADIDDVHELVGGARPASWLAAEVALEEFVLRYVDGDARDAELTALFHKRNLRIHATMGPAGSSMTRHNQCQRFDGTPAAVLQL